MKSTDLKVLYKNKKFRNGQKGKDRFFPKTVPPFQDVRDADSLKYIDIKHNIYCRSQHASFKPPQKIRTKILPKVPSRFKFRSSVVQDNR